jgi:hypothetical protein
VPKRSEELPERVKREEVTLIISLNMDSRDLKGAAETGKTSDIQGPALISDDVI